MGKFLPILISLIGSLLFLSSVSFTTQVAILKYNGGGDWYSNPTALRNLVLFCNNELGTSINPDYKTVDASSSEIFDFPFIHMTGHGNVVFNSEEMTNLRKYLLAGGFLHIDDNYGMDRYIRPEIKKMFPEYELTPLSSNHPVFHQQYHFENGLPKIHEHDQLPPEALGIVHNGRLILLYTHESDLGDGWEDPEVHNDPAEVRLKALKMGANIVQYALMQKE